MSIQRYESLGITDKCNNGDYVLYSDHLTDKQTALDAQQAAHAAEVERLKGERDEMRDARDILRSVAEKTEELRKQMESVCDAAVLERDAEVEALKAISRRVPIAGSRDEIEILTTVRDGWQEKCLAAEAERDAAVRERDAACEALRFYADGENYKYPESGDLAVLQDDGSKARAALAKIEGERR